MSTWDWDEGRHKFVIKNCSTDSQVIGNFL